MSKIIQLSTVINGSVSNLANGKDGEGGFDKDFSITQYALTDDGRIFSRCKSAFDPDFDKWVEEETPDLIPRSIP